MQTQRQQLNLYSNNSSFLSNDNIDIFKKNMEEHYDYKVEQFNMKANKEKNNASILIIRNYSGKFPENYTSSLNLMNDENKQKVSEVSEPLPHIIEIINGQLDETLNGKFNIEECSLQRNDKNYSTTNACISIYTGKDDFKLSFKWLKNNKIEGRKTDVSLNNGDAYLIFMDNSDNYTIGEASGDYLNTKKKAASKKAEKAVTKKVEKAATKKVEKALTKKTEKAVTKKVEKTLTKKTEKAATKKVEKTLTKKTEKVSDSKKSANSLNDKNIYTARVLFVNGKNGEVVKGKNGSRLRVAIHKETREVFKKVPGNWTDEGHAKFDELFPDGKAVSNKKNKTTDTKEKKSVATKTKKPKKQVVKEEKKIETHVEQPEKETKENNKENIDSITDILDDELDEQLEDDIDMDDIQSITSETNPTFDDIEEKVVSDSDSEIEEEDEKQDEQSEDEGDIEVADTTELKEETYVESKQDKSLLYHETSTISLQLVTIPEHLRVDVGSNKEDKVYLLTDSKIDEIVLEETHRLGDKVVGLSLNYPVYNLINI